MAATEGRQKETREQETDKAEAGGAAEGPAGAEDLARQLQAALATASENQDKFLRAKAEAENVRRRAETEVANAHKYAVEQLAVELLPVRDSLEAAKSVDLNQGEGVVKSMLEGLDLTLKLLDEAFQKVSVSVVDPQGEKFDPNRHQAMAVVETDEVPPDHVAKVMQKGYLLRDRVLRPALVMVAKPKSSTGA